MGFDRDLYFDAVDRVICLGLDLEGLECSRWEWPDPLFSEPFLDQLLMLPLQPLSGCVVFD